MYAPYGLGDAHSSADSTEVPSPHSLNVVTSCHGAFEATMDLMLSVQRVRSRVRRGADSPFL